jgi:inhibitor of the pro-sigma K processing machinery
MTIKIIVWGVLFISSILLIVQVFRNKQAGRLISTLCMNIVLAAFFLYVVNLLSTYTELAIPINLVTLSTVTLLGIPGVLLLASMKLMLF